MRWIVARATLREILGGCLGTDPRALVFSYGPQGKPALATPAGELQFSLAHSAHLAMYAVTVGYPIGVDVERLRPVPEMGRIAERTFSPRECATLRGLPPTLRPAGFFNCWTRKEAYIKAVGLGLSYPLDRFSVSLAPGEPARLEAIEAEPAHVEGWVLAALAPRSGFVGAVVVGTRPVEVVCERWRER
jgi:4'-phosphopantetheinyl transferase